jgi:hypothetical protein
MAANMPLDGFVTVSLLKSIIILKKIIGKAIKLYQELFSSPSINPIFVQNKWTMITSDQIKDLNTRLDKLRHYL